MMDIAGPKIRVKTDSDEIKVKKGDMLTIGFGNSDIKINLNLSFENVKLKSKIRIDDGKISFSKSSSTPFGIWGCASGISLMAKSATRWTKALVVMLF